MSELLQHSEETNLDNQQQLDTAKEIASAEKSAEINDIYQKTRSIIIESYFGSDLTMGESFKLKQIIAELLEEEKAETEFSQYDYTSEALARLLMDCYGVEMDEYIILWSLEQRYAFYDKIRKEHNLL